MRLKNNSIDCSIIIPMHNSSETIINCLESFCFDISFLDRIEIIVVDDGSTDNSYELVEKYIGNSKKIINLYKNNNGGVSYARNYGIEKAIGEYIYFCDSDDSVNIKQFEKLIDFTITNNVDVAIANYKNISNSVEIKENHRLINNNVLDKKYIKNNILKRFIIGDNTGICNVWNKLYSLKFINQNNIRFNETRSHGEDWEFNINCFIRCNSVICIDDVVYNYYSNNKNIFSYNGDYSYCLINGFETIDNLANICSDIISNKDDIIRYNISAEQFISYLKNNVKNKEKSKNFINNNVVKRVFKYLSTTNDLQLIDRSRKDKLGFYLLSKGFYKMPINYIFR